MHGLFYWFMVWEFIKDLFKGFCRSYNGIGIWFGALSAVFFWLSPNFDLGGKVNATIAIISLPYRLLIVFGFVFVSVILTSYSLYKKQQLIIDGLQEAKTSFFEKNANITIRDLENCIKEIDSWLEYAKACPRGVYQELIRVICDKISPHFCPTDRKSNIEMSVGDCFPKIMLFLRDYRPNLGNDIKAQYDNLKKQAEDILSKCGGNVSPSSYKEVMQLYVEMYILRNSMKTLVEALQDCVTITKEEKENDTLKK